MSENINNNLDLGEKIFIKLKKNKKKIIILFFIFLLSICSVFLLKTNNQKKNELFSEKYIQASLHLASEDNKKALTLLEEIIFEKNKFYSILALNTILEKNLETNSNKIFNYFKVIESMSLDKEQYDLIIFKKALYLIKTSKKDEGFKLLNNLIDTNSKLKNLAKTLVPID